MAAAPVLRLALAARSAKTVWWAGANTDTAVPSSRR